MDRRNVAPPIPVPGLTDWPFAARLAAILVLNTAIGFGGMLTENLVYSQCIGLVSESLGCQPIPPMLLQPLVENAIKHGLEPRTEGGCIHIRAGVTAGMLSVEVTDDGAGFGAAGDAGQGLANLRARLNAVYGNRGRLTLTENRRGGVTARLDLPHQEQA